MHNQLVVVFFCFSNELVYPVASLKLEFSKFGRLQYTVLYVVMAGRHSKNSIVKTVETMCIRKNAQILITYSKNALSLLTYIYILIGE